MTISYLVTGTTARRDVVGTAAPMVGEIVTIEGRSSFFGPFRVIRRAWRIDVDGETVVEITLDTAT